MINNMLHNMIYIQLVVYIQYRVNMISAGVS